VIFFSYRFREIHSANRGGIFESECYFFEYEHEHEHEHEKSKTAQILSLCSRFLGLYFSAKSREKRIDERCAGPLSNSEYKRTA
jgi:hypothetical protein